MAYNQPKTCRFYINDALWTTNLGYTGDAETTDIYIFNNFVNQGGYELDPTKSIEVKNDAVGGSAMYQARLSPYLSWGCNYIAVLGHNFGSTGGNVRIQNIFSENNDKLINFAPDSSNILFSEYDGFSLATFKTRVSDPDYPEYFRIVFNDYGGNITGQPTIGALSIGNFWDMPHSADVNISQSVEMEGSIRHRTKGGYDFAGHRYTSAPKWNNGLAPFELASPATDIATQQLSRTGRRTWGLSFSYIDTKNIFPDINKLTHHLHIEDGVYADNSIDKSVLTDPDSFYAQVINKTMGGQNRFIFQPDKDDFSNIAICKFDGGFKFNQVANNTYNIKLKIREIW